MLQAVDELTPRSADRVGRRLAGVLEQLHPSTEFTRNAPRISRLATTNVGVLSTSRDNTVMTRSDEPVLADRAPRADYHTDERCRAPSR